VDGPSARITLSEPGRQRTIEDNCLLGNEIDELEAAVDAAVHIQQWVFIDEGELQTQIDQGWEVTVHGEEYAQQALGWDDPGVLRVLIENGLALDSRDRDGQTLLMRAIEANRMKSVRELLEMGADPKALDHQGLAPAPHAGFKGVEVCKLFFKHGVGVNYQDAYGQTMLISAATNRDLETLKFLIESGANPNFRRRDGYSAIGMAKRERDQYQSLVDATFRPDYFGNREIERALYTDLVRKCDAVIEYLKEHGGKE
jgi:ankyrin repeat protein